MTGKNPIDGPNRPSESHKPGDKFPPSTSSRISFARSYASLAYSEYSPQELEVLIETCTNQIQTYSTENEVLEKFIIRANSELLSGMKHYLDSTSSTAVRVQAMAEVFGSPERASVDISIGEGSSGRQILDVSPSRNMYHRSTLRHTSFSPGQFKITVSMRTEIIISIMEDMRSSLEQFVNECRIAKLKLKAAIEEKTITLKEVKLSKASLEQTFLIEGMDSIGNRIPAERFLKFINDLLKNSDQSIAKMRMNISKLQSQLRRLKSQLNEKLELGEMIQSTDFDELRIQNKEYSKEMQQKIQLIMEMKKITGKCCQNLVTKKSQLDEMTEKLRLLLSKIDAQRNMIVKLSSELVKSANELTKAKNEYMKLKRLLSTFNAPTVIDYMKQKAKLQEIEGNIKIFMRRLNLQETTINMLKQKLKVTSPFYFRKFIKTIRDTSAVVSMSDYYSSIGSVYSFEV